MHQDLILILDLGGYQANAVARRLRSLGVYSEILPCSVSAEEILAKAPKGVALAGGPGNLPLNREVFSLGIPLLSMGYAAISMIRALGGHYAGAQLENRAALITFYDDPLFAKLQPGNRYFNRIDAVDLPKGFVPLAALIDGALPAFGNPQQKLYGIQFYPETNDPDGAQILRNFAIDICGCADDWSTASFINGAIGHLQTKVGDRDVIAAVSGGCDSTVCAALLHRALGDHVKCIFVDTGLLRKNEVDEVSMLFRDRMGINLTVVDRREQVLNALEGAQTIDDKRRIVQDTFVRALQDEARLYPNAGFLAEGIRYSDTLKKAIPDYEADLAPLQMLYPLRTLFRDELIRVGKALAVPTEQLERKAFPSAGLAARCIGAVTKDKLRMLRQADAILLDILRESGMDKKLNNAFIVLTDIETTVNSKRGLICALRAVTFSAPSRVNAARLPYDLLDRICKEITENVEGVNRVVYDITSSDRAETEWV